MMYEVSQRFYFDAAHTLNREIETAGSRRIHGHTYWAEVAVRGTPDPVTGMVVDSGMLKARLHEVRDRLDHHLLDEVPDLGPATLENLCAFIARGLEGFHPGLATVRVWREANGDNCTLHLLPKL
jgi:6-pyruvoyltetrahydropterin/6-carboxytetrahydropterin synthase